MILIDALFKRSLGMKQSESSVFCSFKGEQGENAGKVYFLMWKQSSLYSPLLILFSNNLYPQSTFTATLEIPIGISNAS